MNVPQEIRCQVIRLYIDGKSEDEMINLMGLSKDQVENVLSDLDSPDGQNILTYVLALNYGKDGLDMNEYVDLTQAKKKLVQQGVLPKNALPFVTNVAEFTETTGLGADVFVPAYSIYQKLASMRIRNYQDLQKRKYQSLLALESYRKELKELQERYRLLAKVSVGKEISETR